MDRSSVRKAWLSGLVLVLISGTAGADDLDDTMSWTQVASKGQSVVFGRFEGRFEGPEFRGRKIQLRRVEDGKQQSISIGEGLGYFEAVLPAGSYRVEGIEATYYPPPIRPVNPARYRPLRQRFEVGRRGSETGPAAFVASSDRPVYLGTIKIDNRPDGIVYRGHYIRIVDEYEEAFGRLERNYPRFASSLAERGIDPVRRFILKPVRPESPLEVVDVDDPIGRARDYIVERKFRQAINWLQTFMPTSDEERSQVQLLIGEALLGDGKYVEAIVKLGQVLEADPENLRALRLLARAHAWNADLEDARGLYEALAKALPDDPEAHLQLGYMYALRSEKSRSAAEFASAFRYDLDYLLHDVAPFAVALKAVKVDTGQYVPAMVVKQTVPFPSGMQSRRASEQGAMALVIDHRGNVVAAQVTPGNSSEMPILLIAIVRAKFRPAALNGVAVPSLLLMMGESSGRSATR